MARVSAFELPCCACGKPFNVGQDGKKLKPKDQLHFFCNGMPDEVRGGVITGVFLVLARDEDVLGFLGRVVARLDLPAMLSTMAVRLALEEVSAASKGFWGNKPRPMIFVLLGPRCA